MGMLIDGVWTLENHFPTNDGGEFRRKATTFRDRITADGSSGFPAESGRYHLYVSYACPWAHRTLILRSLRGLEDVISVSVVDAFMTADGWHFEGRNGSTEDHVLGKRFLREVYQQAKPDFTGRVTVPVLYDKQTGRIVNNESTEIIRMLNEEFGPGLAKNPEVDLYPEGLRETSDALRDQIYNRFNNGVYRAGFARSQEAYERAVTDVFDVLDELEAILAEQRYLASDTRMTEADICAFGTLVRFDPVYVGHFKCNLRRIADYEHLPNYLRDLYQTPGIAKTVRLDQIKEHYYRSHESVNPSRIVPLGPDFELAAPHGRG
ncbi:MAG: glutathione S-transferase family protein [Deltaproteobacteria bacterium]|nr:glutathione S-transferase family protein [Deltaproteobacteria bacterium]